MSAVPEPTAMVFLYAAKLLQSSPLLDVERAIEGAIVTVYGTDPDKVAEAKNSVQAELLAQLKRHTGKDPRYIFQDIFGQLTR